MKTLKSKKGEIKLPCLQVILAPSEKVIANNYNPNHVPENNMLLLEQSIINNGFCFPIVTIYDSESELYIIVDGFHRYTVLTERLKVKEIPIVVLDHDIAKRMYATVEFNRAHGNHSVEEMADLVQSLVNQGETDEAICKHLGMEMEEVFRLKQITGIAELFKNQTYSKSWEMEEVADG